MIEKDKACPILVEIMTHFRSIAPEHQMFILGSVLKPVDLLSTWKSPKWSLYKFPWFNRIDSAFSKYLTSPGFCAKNKSFVQVSKTHTNLKFIFNPLTKIEVFAHRYVGMI